MRNRICLAAAVLCALASEPAAAQVRTGSVLDRKVTVTFQQAPLESVLRTLRRQYGVRISYSNTALNLRQPVTLDVQNQPLRNVLSTLLRDTNIAYELVGDQLVLHPAPPRSTPKPAETAAAATTTTVSRTAAESVAPAPAPARPSTAAAAQPARSVAMEEGEAAGDKAKAPIRKAPLASGAGAAKTATKPETDAKAPTGAKPGSAALAKGTAATGGAAKSPAAAKSQRPGTSGGGKTNKPVKVPAGPAADQPSTANPVPGATANPNSTNGTAATNAAGEAPAAATAAPAGAAPNASAQSAPPAAKVDSVAQAASAAPEEVPARVTYTRPAQISFIGPLGSNGLRSGQTVNKVSINVLGGYAAGVDGFEAGGLFNIDRDTVKGVQIAGLGNYVGRNLQGFQAAGLMNVLGGGGAGGQAAGLFNLATRPLAGVQMAGLFNFVGPRKKPWGDPTATASAQAAVTPAAEAGTAQRPWVQAAGLFNVALTEVRGTQIAGLFNAAGTVKGVQLAGLLNVADSVQGLSIAPLNFVRRGYHRVDLTYSEAWPATATLKLGGSAAFYTFFAGSYQPGNTQNRRWGLGYGLGTDMWARRRLSLSLDALAMQVSEEQEGWTTALNLHNQLRLLVGFTPFKESSPVRLIAGPVINVLVTERYDTSEGAVYSNLLRGRKPVLDEGDSVTRVLGWVGYSVGVRL